MFMFMFMLNEPTHERRVFELSEFKHSHNVYNTSNYLSLMTVYPIEVFEVCVSVIVYILIDSILGDDITALPHQISFRKLAFAPIDLVFSFFSFPFSFSFY